MFWDGDSDVCSWEAPGFVNWGLSHSPARHAACSPQPLGNASPQRFITWAPAGQGGGGQTVSALCCSRSPATTLAPWWGPHHPRAGHSLAAPPALVQ